MSIWDLEWMVTVRFIANQGDSVKWRAGQGPGKAIGPTIMGHGNQVTSSRPFLGEL